MDSEAVDDDDERVRERYAAWSSIFFVFSEQGKVRE